MKEERATQEKVLNDKMNDKYREQKDMQMQVRDAICWLTDQLGWFTNWLTDGLTAYRCVKTRPTSKLVWMSTNC